MEDIVIRRPRVGDIVLYEGQPHTHIGKVPAIITNVITEVATMDVDLFVFARNDSGVVKSNVPRANIIQPGFYTFIPSPDVRYPYRDGDLLCIGPEVLMHPDGSVIIYKGQMYVVSGSATSRGHLGRLQDRVIELTNLNAELEERHTRDSGTIARLSSQIADHHKSASDRSAAHSFDVGRANALNQRVASLEAELETQKSTTEKYQRGEQKAVDLLNRQQSFVESMQKHIDRLDRENTELKRSLTELADRTLQLKPDEALATPRTDQAIPLPFVDELSPPLAFYPSMPVIVDQECDRVGMFHNGQWLYLNVDNVDLAPGEAAARMELRGENFHGSGEPEEIETRPRKLNPRKREPRKPVISDQTIAEAERAVREVSEIIDRKDREGE